MNSSINKVTHPMLRQSQTKPVLDRVKSTSTMVAIDTPPHVLVLTQQNEVMQDQIAKLTAVPSTTSQGQENQVNFRPRAISQEKNHPQDRRHRSKSTERQGHAQQSRCQDCGYSYYGDQNHSCHAYCHNCRKRGHFAPVCRSKIQNYFRPKIPKL